MTDALDKTLWIDLLGKKFAQFGRGPEEYDCYGLVMEIFRRRGIIIPDVKYGQSVEDKNSAFVANEKGGWYRCAMRPGAALAFRTAGYIQHCGVCIDYERFIHASENHGAVLVGHLSRGFPRHNKLLAGVYDHVER